MDIIIVLILLIIMAFAINHIYKSKKKGKKCIGCPYDCSNCPSRVE